MTVKQAAAHFKRQRHLTPVKAIPPSPVVAQVFSDIERVRAAMEVLLDQVDYTKGACSVTEMVGAVLPKEVITRARKALEETKPK